MVDTYFMSTIPVHIVVRSSDHGDLSEKSFDHADLSIEETGENDEAHEEDKASDTEV